MRLLALGGPALVAAAIVAAGARAGAWSWPPRLPPRSEPPPGAIALSSAPPQTVELRLPFTGIWGVVQGFDSNETGTHVGYAAYALDFVPAERITARTHERRRRLTDFPCFGQPILAPADGRVVWSRDGAVDHEPYFRGKHEAGNFVILEHAPGELTEFRHLQAGSVRVAVGDWVRRGEAIGRCGNSGDAHTPHLHLGFLGSVEPIATRPMKLSHYEVLEPDGHWRAGDGVPREKEILRGLP